MWVGNEVDVRLIRRCEGRGREAAKNMAFWWGMFIISKTIARGCYYLIVYDWYIVRRASGQGGGMRLSWELVGDVKQTKRGFSIQWGPNTSMTNNKLCNYIIYMTNYLK